MPAGERQEGATGQERVRIDGTKASARTTEQEEGYCSFGINNQHGSCQNAPETTPAPRCNVTGLGFDIDVQQCWGLATVVRNKEKSFPLIPVGRMPARHAGRRRRGLHIYTACSRPVFAITIAKCDPIQANKLRCISSCPNSRSKDTLNLH